MVDIRSPIGLIDGPRLPFDPMGSVLVSLEFIGIFCCIVCKKITIVGLKDFNVTEELGLK